MDLSPSDRDVLEHALECMRGRGYAGEAYLQELAENRIEVYQGQPETRLRAVSKGIGVRVERDLRTGSSQTTQLDREGMEAAVQRAVAAAEVAQPREVSGLAAPPTSSYPRTRFLRGSLLELTDARRLEMAQAAEQAAFDADPRITKSEMASYRDFVERVALFTTAGITATEAAGLASLAVVTVATHDGEERTGHHGETVRDPLGLDPRRIGTTAARKGLSLLGSRKAPSTRAAVLLEPEVGASLLGLLAAPLSAQACLLGSSMLADKIDAKIGASCLRLWDDPLHEVGVGGFAFDAEGVASRRKAVVEDGILRTHLHNSYTARRTGVPSTGNAVRGGYGGSVGIGPSNLYLEQGGRSRDELLASMDHGFLVQEIMGLHMADTVRGDFSFGFVGQRIERGQITHPVEEMTMAGNLLDLLHRVVEVGDDLWFDGDLGSPSLLVEGLSISGT
jgi:PmbA protein